MITQTQSRLSPGPWITLADEASPRVVGHAPPSARRIVGQFIAANLLAGFLLIVASVLISRDAAKDESIADARHTTDVVARAVVEPVLRNDIVHSNPAAVAALNRAIKGPIVGASGAVRVKIWTATGRIVYSDEPRLIGQHYTLRPDELDTLKSGGTDAELSDVSRPENRFERSDGNLLEVYRAVHTPNGTPLLFETYSRYTAVTSRSGAIWLKFAPLTIGVLLLLQLLQLPLARRMTRQLREGQTEREDLLRKTADASADERRRIAGTLHDGVVQHLAGASFIVAGAIDHLGSTPPTNDTARTAAGLRPALSAIRESIGGLRAMLVDIYPPSLRSAGLTVALSDLTAPLAGRGIIVHSDINAGIDLPPETEQLIFRVARETLRTVGKHAQARVVHVQLLRADDHVVLVVADDGIGFDVAARSAASGDGHLGLQVLSDLASGAGASLEISSATDVGTRLRLRVPVA
jgi:two-component system, NarL family, sensor kinase